jgi:rare lipoprotein A
VNDRGPFADDRIIDVSRHAARLLGFERSGVAKVRVEIDVADSLTVAAAAGRGSIQLSGPVVLAVVCAMTAAIGVWTLAIDV